MIAENHDARLVSALHELRKAFTIYDKAWFYVDRSKSQELVFGEPISYVADIKEIENILKDEAHQGKVGALLSLHYISSRVLRTYEEAWRLLLSRNKHSSKEYAESYDKAKKIGLEILDKDIKSTFLAVEDLNEKVEELKLYLLESLVFDRKKGDWCGYEVECGLLNQRCMLLMDEITHLATNNDRLQDLFAGKKQSFAAKVSLAIAVTGIVVSALFSGVSLIYNIAKGSSPAVVIQGQSETSNLLIAHYLTSLRDEVGILRDKLTELRVSQTGETDAIAAAIKKFESSLDSEAGDITRQNKALEDLDHDFKGFLVTQTNGPFRPASLSYDDAKLRDQVKSVQDAIADLKKAVEQMKPPQVIIEEAPSKSKRGFFNWF